MQARRLRAEAALLALLLTLHASAGLVCALECTPQAATASASVMGAPVSGHCHDAPSDGPACRSQIAPCDEMAGPGEAAKADRPAARHSERPADRLAVAACLPALVLPARADARYERPPHALWPVGYVPFPPLVLRI